MSGFRKKKECPTSYELVDMVNREVDGVDGLRIAAHLAVCDFCSAELELYRAYPLIDEGASETPALPTPLFELAQTMLTRETIHISRLEYLLKETS